MQWYTLTKVRHLPQLSVGSNQEIDEEQEVDASHYEEEYLETLPHKQNHGS